MDCGPQIEIKEVKQIQTVSLDTYLPTVGVDCVDFLQLDTQGTELEVLRGAKSFLCRSILGAQVEVEFSPIYKDQSLFSEIDAYMRQAGFMLFDVRRNYYRRKNYPLDLNTRGQLLWGDAFYLKDHGFLSRSKKSKEARIKLAVIATFFGFHDYALEIFDTLFQEATEAQDSEAISAFGRLRDEFISSLTNRQCWIRLTAWMLKLGLGLGRFFNFGGRMAKKLSDLHAAVTQKRSQSWED